MTPLRCGHRIRKLPYSPPGECTLTLTRVRAAEVKVIILFICAEEILDLFPLLKCDPFAVPAYAALVLLYMGKFGLVTCADFNGAVGVERLTEVSALFGFKDAKPCFLQVGCSLLLEIIGVLFFNQHFSRSTTLQ